MRARTKIRSTPKFSPTPRQRDRFLRVFSVFFKLLPRCCSRFGSRWTAFSFRGCRRWKKETADDWPRVDCDRFASRKTWRKKKPNKKKASVFEIETRLRSNWISFSFSFLNLFFIFYFGQPLWWMVWRVIIHHLVHLVDIDGLLDWNEMSFFLVIPEFNQMLNQRPSVRLRRLLWKSTFPRYRFVETKIFSRLASRA